MRICDCGHSYSRNGTCPSCELYNAAVHAQQAAADHIAKSFHRKATGAWLNEHGAFADIKGIKRQVGSPEQAAPFVALTGAARRVITFYGEESLRAPSTRKAGA